MYWWSNFQSRKESNGKALILMYHRIAEVFCDPWSLCVSPKTFETHLEIVKKTAPVLTMQELKKCLMKGTLPAKSILITFDDGYADNFLAALPILQRHNLPATVFVVSTQIDSKKEFWWDELERIFLQTPSLPQKLMLRVGDKAIESDLGTATNYRVTDHDGNKTWRAWEDPLTPRHALYYSLWKELRPLSNEKRQSLLSQIRAWANLDAEGREENRAMSLSELKSVSHSQLIEIGCHTATHPQLSSLASSDQEQEIRENKTYLEQVTGRRMTTFAYPYGGKTDYTEETARLVESSGFALACSNFEGRVTKDSAHYELPRMPVENWEAGIFEKRLNDWLN